MQRTETLLKELVDGKISKQDFERQTNSTFEREALSLGFSGSEILALN